jgi:hypothetical protein
MSNRFRFRQTSRAIGFRAWLEETDGDVTDLPNDAFNRSNAFRRTGVNRRSSDSGQGAFSIMASQAWRCPVKARTRSGTVSSLSANAQPCHFVCSSRSTMS